MKLSFYSVLVLLISICFCSEITAQSSKIVGYLPYYRFTQIDELALDQMTHLCIAFANPDMSGNLDVGGKDILPIVEKAHENDLVVFLSLAGGALTADWAAAWKQLTKTTNRSAFIHKIILYLKVNELDGADMDLEWSHVNDDYSGFVLELKDSLSKHDFLMSAALPGTYRYPQISDEAMFAYDFINLMAYDLTGPWAPADAGPHSPYSFAVSSINYWKNQGMAGEDLTLGIPFYGYDFTNSSSTTAFTYRQMVNENENYAWLDKVGNRYYNGIPTVEAKTELGMNEVGGVCLWEIGQDHLSEFSLLNAIYNKSGLNTSLASQASEAVYRVFPNPFSNEINIETKSSEEANVILSNSNGQILFSQRMRGDFSFQTDDLSAGFYFLRLEFSTGSQSMKLVKI